MADEFRKFRCVNEISGWTAPSDGDRRGRGFFYSPMTAMSLGLAVSAAGSISFNKDRSWRLRIRFEKQVRKDQGIGLDAHQLLRLFAALDDHVDGFTQKLIAKPIQRDDGVRAARLDAVERRDDELGLFEANGMTLRHYAVSAVHAKIDGGRNDERREPRHPTIILTSYYFFAFEIHKHHFRIPPVRGPDRALPLTAPQRA